METTAPSSTHIPGSSEALLQSLATLSLQQFATEQALITAILNAIADQLQVRTPFLSATLAGKFEVLDLVNRKGCTLQAGAVLPLSESY